MSWCVHDLPRGHSLLDRLQETGASFLFGVPTHAIDLLSEMRARRVERLGAVRGFRISGAAAPRAGGNRADRASAWCRRAATA